MNKLMTPGAKRITRAELSLIPTPPSTDTHRPVPHADLINALEEALSFRHIQITAEEYCVAKGGDRLFGMLEVNASYEGVTFGIGIRNAHDKSMRLGLVAGYRVTVCSNMMFSGDFKPMLAKHTKHFDLTETLSIGVDRIQRGWQPLRERINFMRGCELTTEAAQALIYRAFMQERFPLRLMKSVHSHYFAPRHDEFQPRTVWSVSNAFTSSFKDVRPDKHYELTARLGKFLEPYAQTF
jgi:hypothetical protein